MKTCCPVVTCTFGFIIICTAALETEALLLDVEVSELEVATLLLDSCTEELLLLDDSDESLALDTACADELLEFAAPQLAAKSLPWLVMVLAGPLITILVQPLVGTSAAGKESVPQPPLGSTLKRAPPVAGKKLRQISKLVVEPATAVNKSPSAQPF